MSPLPPNTTPVPPSIFSPAMSPATTTSVPTPSPIPSRPKQPEPEPKPEPEQPSDGKPPSSPPLPRIRVHLNDLSDAGTSIFLSSVSAPTLLPDSIRTVQEHLYPSPSPSSSSSTQTQLWHCPPTRSVTLILRPMDGVAYTTGVDLDPEQHKEIHLSTRYVCSIAPASRRAPEIAGVLVHELVHCYQWSGRGSAPGGLVEGVADWVRLRAGLAPPHWKTPGDGDGGDVGEGDRWDAGYQRTAYFLDYLEGRYGDGTVRRLNEKLRVGEYEEEAFWAELLGRSVGELWEDYKESLGKEKGGR
ncbi:peptidase of plants and bacteria-domain-containing protein [Biscogniauxia mediterranea]|nr:peptidase of plants and bacteria-domain-containing protein [Biscogniauxia mediterranea]